MEKEQDLSISDLSVGLELIDKRDNTIAHVVEWREANVSSSVCVQLYRKSKKGINCKNWYEMGWFNRYFKKK